MAARHDPGGSRREGRPVTAQANAALYGTNLFGEAAEPEGRGTLERRYVAPPFNVWDRRQAYWHERRRAWHALGIDSIETREHLPTFAHTGYAAQGLPTASVFDPVVAELAYTWFSAPGDKVLDPFAGGSVRGIVAAVLGREYVGVDLRQEQCDANERQALEVANGYGMASPVTWKCGDSADVIPLEPADYRLVFTCPPYFDLEQYCDDPLDLSNMTWDGFLLAYEDIILSACEKLEPDSFAVWVVGDVRDKREPQGLRGLPAATVEAHAAAGLAYYNEICILDPLATLPVRAHKGFDASRKVGRTWQQALVFVKGDPRAAARRLGAFTPPAEG